MKKSLIALALVGAFAAPVFAEEAAAPASEHTVTGNVGLFSSYRFRGLDQTFGKPALQGGFDYSHSSGVYLGNWNSNVSETYYPGGNLEMDFYGGYKQAFGDFGVDVGGLYYYYPGTNAAKGQVIDNFELYAGVSWKFITFKYSHALTDYFNVAGTKNTKYFDLSAAYDLGDGWGVNGHIGRTQIPHEVNHDFNYTDWKLGVTKDVGGFVFGLSYVGTDAKRDSYTFTNANNSSKTIFAGKNTVVVSVSKTF